MTEHFITGVHNKRGRIGTGIRLSLLNAALNLLLFLLKYTAGTLSGSIAITADGFNHLADAGSCLLAPIGFRLSGRRPDRRYPFGYGRIEYLSGLLMSLVILAIGGRLLLSSIDKIVHPQAVECSVPLLIVLSGSIAVKGAMYRYNKIAAEVLRSSVFRAEAADCLCDCIATLAVAGAVIAEQLTGLQIDGVAGIPVALCILYAGFCSVRDSAAPLIGRAVGQKERMLIRRIAASHGCCRAEKIAVHDYGAEMKLITFYLCGQDAEKHLNAIRRETAAALNAEVFICPIDEKSEPTPHNRRRTADNSDIKCRRVKG